jgi:hypothetical protein
MDKVDQEGGTMERRKYKVRRVISRGSPSYQLGHYEITGKPAPGAYALVRRRLALPQRRDQRHTQQRGSADHGQ